MPAPALHARQRDIRDALRSDTRRGRWAQPVAALTDAQLCAAADAVFALPRASQDTDVVIVAVALDSDDVVAVGQARRGAKSSHAEMRAAFDAALADTHRIGRSGAHTLSVRRVRAGRVQLFVGTQMIAVACQLEPDGRTPRPVTIDRL